MACCQVDSLTGAFGRLFVFLLLATAPWLLAADPCHTPPNLPVAEVSRIIDGDTLLLTDGRRVRMVGLDAPELGRQGRPDEPFAREAARHLTTLVQLSERRVRLQTGPEPRDRYGRTLAVVHTDRHGDLAAHLLRQGLALVAVVPPNLMALECHQAAEAHARAARDGLWGLGTGPVVNAYVLSGTGFAVVSGTASSWTVRREDRFLTLDGTLVLRFRRADLDRWFNGRDIDRLAGQPLEVRGWVHPWGRDERAITVRHPASIRIIVTDAP